ncbi:phosphotransferase, partial [Aquipuribacter hungaricus]
LLVGAMPGTVPVAVAPAHAGRDDVDAALVHDADGGIWVVTAPRTAEAGVRVDAETEAVRLLAGVLPFDVPRPRADVALPEGGRAIVFPAPRGRPVDLLRLAASPGVCRSVGRSLAALHDVTTAVVERAGVPVRDAGEVRRRRLDELDRGATTSQVPPVLLERWEAVLDDTSLWDFSPTVVHGDLVAERLVVTGEEVTAVLDWTDLHVGDPAEDLAWLAVGAEPETVAEVLQAYRSSRHGSVDEDLLRRAVLHGEMALVRWLLHGVATDDAEVREDATGMLEQLAGWVEAENLARHHDEESARLAEERARQAEEDARLAEEHARQAEEEARLAEEDELRAEDEARLTEDDALQAEDEARLAGERALEAEDDARAAGAHGPQAEDDDRPDAHGGSPSA